MQRMALRLLLARPPKMKISMFSTVADHDILDIFNEQARPRSDLKKQLARKLISSKSRIKEEIPLKICKDHVIIECLRPEFNHHRNQKYDVKEIPLACKGWKHPKSKGDCFTIKLYGNDVDMADYFHGNLSSFEDLKLDAGIVDALKTINIHRPTFIQEQTIPVILSGKNALIAAETGCGKTLAYLVPILQQILRWKKLLPDRPPNSPLVLILCPSRELATQIGEVAKQLSAQLPFSCNTLLGGKTKRMMLHPAYRDVDIQISTPGVISKLSTVGIYDLQDVKHVVLDESDSMLDDSFNEIMLRLLKKTRIWYKNDPKSVSSGCQLTLVSATRPTSVYTILEGIVEPDSLETIISPKLHRILPHVVQKFFRLGLTQKPTKLLQLVKNAVQMDEPVLIFSNKTKTCDWIALMLHENGVPVFNLNGDMPSEVRLGKFELFKSGEMKVLSCTDIASRGLDTSNAKLVINYDFPNHMSDYIHRCGRVGRYSSPKDCQIMNFVTYPHEIELVSKIEMAVRTMKDLPDVNANIARLIAYRK